MAGPVRCWPGCRTLDLADRLRRTTDATTALAKPIAPTLEAASDQMAARAARFEAEALKTRAQVAEAMRDEAVRQAISHRPS